MYKLMNPLIALAVAATLLNLALLTGVTFAQAQAPSANGSTSAGKTVKGSGTTGQLPKWTAPDTIGDSIVTEANGNIGIGTTTPGSKLTVAGRIEAFTSGLSSAVLGQSETGSGVRGNSNTGFGVFGSSTSGKGVQGLSQASDGVFGFSLTGNGVSGATGNSSTAGVLGSNSGGGGTGVLGQAFFGTGLRGISSTGFGVFGSSETFTAVEARSNTGFGIFGSSETNTGIHGQSVGGTGVFGGTNGDGRAGVHGVNTNPGGKNEAGGPGVLGESSISTGVYGISGSGIGVLGLSGSSTGNGVGVYGLGGDNNSAAAGNGVIAEGGNGIGAGSRGGDGIIAFAGNGADGAPKGRAGFFFGDVVVTGNLSKGGGSFRIDHPLDPANKYLSHSFVESPDMMNIYNGNVTTNEDGEARVTLPDYFAALNRDFRYQLTVIGQFAQAIVAEEIVDNRFTIKTDKPRVKVSWQVTGIRQDAWANKHRITVEEDKAPAERGYFLHPELFGQPEEKNLEWARRPDLMKRITETRKQKP